MHDLSHCELYKYSLYAICHYYCNAKKDQYSSVYYNIYEEEPLEYCCVHIFSNFNCCFKWLLTGLARNSWYIDEAVVRKAVFVKFAVSYLSE